MSERIWQRKKILQDATFLKTVKEVVAALNKLGVRYAMVGGLAVAYHANPPVTIDADFLVDTENMDVLEVLFKGEGWGAYPLLFRVNQRGFPKFGWAMRKKGRTEVDLISTSSDAYLSSVTKNAVEVSFAGVLVPVVTVEDLVVMKTLVGREKDIDDTIALRQAGKVDERYVKRMLDRLF